LSSGQLHVGSSAQTVMQGISSMVLQFCDVGAGGWHGLGQLLAEIHSPPVLSHSALFGSPLKSFRDSSHPKENSKRKLKRVVQYIRHTLRFVLVITVTDWSMEY
jgi:hypothetical protein